MKTFETVIIFNPKNYADSIKIFKDMCQEFTGTKYKIKMDDIGENSLAYPLKNGSFNTGYYIVFTWQGTHTNVTELERHMRVNDDVLKFMTVEIDSDKYTDWELLPSSPSSEQPDALDVLLGLADYKNNK